jgi:FtsH-binding integral membrane protein
MERKHEMDIAMAELVVGLVAVAWIATLVWSLYVILTTSTETWKAAQMSQSMWIVVVVFMPLIGAILFAAAGARRLRTHDAGSG